MAALSFLCFCSWQYAGDGPLPIQCLSSRCVAKILQREGSPQLCHFIPAIEGSALQSTVEGDGVMAALPSGLHLEAQRLLCATWAGFDCDLKEAS